MLRFLRPFACLLLFAAMIPALAQSSLPAAAASAADAPAVDDEPLPVDQAFALSVRADGPARLLLHWTIAQGYYLYRDRTTIALADAGGARLGAPQWPRGVTHQDPQFGETVVYYDTVDVPVAVQRNGAASLPLRLRVRFQGCQEGSVCYPPTTREIAVALPAGAAEVAAADVRGGGVSAAGFAAALLAALLGGLILNLMPCVLPILSLKAMALAESGESPAAARRHALAYTAGVLCAFAALGACVWLLRGAGQALGWGFQLQQPALVGALVLVMVAVGLGMSGVVQFGAGLAGGALAQRGGPWADFLTGVLACVVASPCTAPFMGSALAFALYAPIALALAVFLALGLGLALPFLLIGLCPPLRRWLPRPGRWMETLKQLLAYPMYLAAVWLLWVLGRLRGVDAMALALVAAVTLALGLWWLERQRYGRRAQRALAWLLIAASCLPLAALPGATAVQSTDAARRALVPGSIAYSAERLAALRRAGEPVFVDVSTDWCITCKANERAVLSTAAFRALLARTGTAYLVADYTDGEPAITALLDRYRAVGVPLYLAFPRGGGDARKLPAVLTLGELQRAFAAAR
ncbi:C-type cytochrome biogenesis protein [Mizugakiibacter sediminis]|uniref:C-type cytochrome biogenesis protein n=1 Tax=Mizugakiibacter sediminis TaxID=1475481 RepID=A0A0K8QKD7_9GAMM|nr:protein-disulfide reductase DsbD domain-containing protein [Mizugakiibacter sediminis]GAP64952.1 C-type cytochrome biogenesis protein [Mizugakiibacter sediminis]